MPRVSGRITKRGPCSPSLPAVVGHSKHRPSCGYDNDGILGLHAGPARRHRDEITLAVASKRSGHSCVAVGRQVVPWYGPPCRADYFLSMIPPYSRGVVITRPSQRVRVRPASSIEPQGPEPRGTCYVDALHQRYYVEFRFNVHKGIRPRACPWPHCARPQAT